MNEETRIAPPDERAFRADVAKAAFHLAVREDKWHLRMIEWPYAHIGVFAIDTSEYVLRFDCAGYPQTAPTAGLWDPEIGAVLPTPRWPRSRGGRVGHVFNPNWLGGVALYLPCDRIALPGHPAWLTEHASKVWRPADGITQYLEIVHALLNSSDYQAPPIAEA
jgi:hypothetical protein